MTLKELASVMSNQFIAVEDIRTNEVFISGCAYRAINHPCNYMEVVNIQVPCREGSATIITVK